MEGWQRAGWRALVLERRPVERARLAALGLRAGGGGAHGAVAACCCWTDEGRLLPAVPSEPFPCAREGCDLLDDLVNVCQSKASTGIHGPRMQARPAKQIDKKADHDRLGPMLA